MTVRRRRWLRRLTVGIALAAFAAPAAARPGEADAGAAGSTQVTRATLDAGVSWDGAVLFGLGTLVLVLALGFGVGYIRRPRIAGLRSSRG